MATLSSTNASAGDFDFCTIDLQAYVSVIDSSLHFAHQTRFADAAGSNQKDVGVLIEQFGESFDFPFSVPELVSHDPIPMAEFELFVHRGPFNNIVGNIFVGKIGHSNRPVNIF